MDETDSPQTPVELLIILAAIADEKIPIQTIAPKFTGRFNKGVDYVGDVAQFESEFSDDLAAIAFAVKTYGLPANLKLSVHSGRDKFSIYKRHLTMREELRRGRSPQDGRNDVARGDSSASPRQADRDWRSPRRSTREAYGHRDELCAPYATVIDIDPAKLPTPDAVDGWTSEQYVSALRHDQSNPAYNPSLRQLLHVGFKVAAKMGDRYLNALEANEEVVARNVTDESL